MSRTANGEKNLVMGCRLKSLREERELTQEQVGAVIGVQRSAIRKYEKGEVVNPPTSSIKALADFFSVSTDYLLGKVEWKSPEQYQSKCEQWDKLHNPNGNLAKGVKLYELIQNIYKYNAFPAPPPIRHKRIYKTHTENTLMLCLKPLVC